MDLVDLEKIKDLVFELVDKGSYQFYRGKGIRHDFNLEENKNVNPPKWNSGFNNFSSFEEAVKWANAMKTIIKLLLTPEMALLASGLLITEYYYHFPREYQAYYLD